MGTTDHDTRGARAGSGTPDAPDAAAALATVAGSDQPLGSHAAQILATEHWSLLATRTVIWNEAMSRANVFLTVLSAAIIALALLADATGFGPQTTTLALVLLPVVLLLGIATYVHDQHPDHRGHRGRGPGGRHRRPGPAGVRGAHGRDGGRWGGGVPGVLGRADAAAAAHRGPAPRAAAIPHPTRGTVGPHMPVDPDDTLQRSPRSRSSGTTTSSGGP
jgi:membrane protein implicated in regulation of membrane protease activity